MLTVIVSFTSCKKEDIKPNEPTPLPVVITEPFVDGNWKMLGYESVINGTAEDFVAVPDVTFQITYTGGLYINGFNLGADWNSSTEAIVDDETWTFYAGAEDEMAIWMTNEQNADYTVYLLERI